MLRESAIAILLLLFPLTLSASSGKFTGQVIDSETGDPLPGANVVVVGTSLGAATNADGEYFILNVPPGIYEVKASYIGYTATTIQNVRAVANLTQQVQFELRAEALATDALFIVAQRPVFEKGATNTVRVMDGEEINQLPVRGATSAVALQAGVVSAEGSGGVGGNAVLNVRGGRGNETAFIVDGVVQNNNVFGGNAGTLSSEAIEQVSVQVGGFEAKFGQAQSGVINITTKSGRSNYAAGGEIISSELTDDYGYNIYNLNFSGPIFPGSETHSFYGLVERGVFADATPSAIGVRIPTIGKDQSTFDDNKEDLWRWNAKTNHRFGNVLLQLAGNGTTRNTRAWGLAAAGVLSRWDNAKNNSHHIPRIKDDSYSSSVRLTHTLKNSSFWTFTGFLRNLQQRRGDGVFFDDVFAYGDTLVNEELRLSGDGQGSIIGRDDIGVFDAAGRVFDNYRDYQTRSIGANVDFTSQIGKHLLEIGAGYTQDRFKIWSLSPSRLAVGLRDDPNTLADERDFDNDGDVDAEDTRLRFEGRAVLNTHLGFTADGREDNASAVKPVQWHVYVQDKIELDDLVLNVGLRLDYFDPAHERLVDEENPLAAGDPQAFDDADFEAQPTELNLVPRIGLGFPVTDNTIFHAQYGKFIQRPRYIDLYWSRNRYDSFTTNSNFNINTGGLASEETIQYEAGVRKTIGDNVALDATLFYKDVKGLVNDFTRQAFRGAQSVRYYGPENTDFGTIKGLALKLDVRRTNYTALSLDYTYSIAEGTGSSRTSSLVAAFRNNDGETPKSIAPLNFDQRHTLVANLDVRLPEGEGGILETAGANLLLSFNSGRPYTAREAQPLLSGATNFGDTQGFINSTAGPGQLRLDLKVDKTFQFGGIRMVPYLWVLNLLDATNANQVWESTGDEFSTGFLASAEARAILDGHPDPEAFIADYQALERDPTRFGIPRQVRLGLRMNIQ